MRAQVLERRHELSQRVLNQPDPQKLTIAIEELNSFLEENLIDQEGPDALRSILFRQPAVEF